MSEGLTSHGLATLPASNLRRWSVPESELLIEYAPEILEEIRIYGHDGLQRLARGGVEVGGVLFGARGDNLVRILAWKPIECEHAKGPSFQLSEKDRLALGQLLQNAKSEPALAELHAVGWFVSHTRGDVCLTPPDLEVFNHYFPWSWQVALVLKPGRAGAAKAGFFLRDIGGTVKSDASYLEFEVEPTGTEAAPRLAVAEERPESRPPRPRREERAADRPAKPRPNDRTAWIWALPLVLAAIVAAMLLQKPAVKTVPGPIAFGVVDNGGELQIHWDKKAQAIQDAVRGMIHIKDGDSNIELPLDVDRLRQGVLAYTRKSGDLDLLMTVYPVNGSPVEESARFVGPSAPGSGSNDADQIRRERDSYAAEAARLREALRKETTRNRELEQLLRILENRLQIDGPKHSNSNK